MQQMSPQDKVSELGLHLPRFGFGAMNTVLFACALLVLASLYVTVPLVPVIAEAFNVGADRAAWAGSAFSVFFAAGCLFFGRLSDRTGRRRMIVVGMAVLALATLLIGLIDNFTMLLLLRSLQGAAAATFSPVALTYAGEVFPPARRVTAIGFISTGFLVAGIFGQVWAVVVEQLAGWQDVFLFLAPLYVLAIFAALLFLPESRVAGGGNTEPIFSFHRFVPVLMNKQLLLCYGITLVVLLTFVGMYSTMGYFLRQPPFALTEQNILAVRAAGMIGMILAPFAGLLSRGIGTLRLMRMGLLLSIIGLAVMSEASSLVLYLVMSVLFVSGIALLVPSLIAQIGQLSGSNRSTATSLYTFVLFIGASIGPLVTPLLLRSGTPALPLLTFAAMLSAAFLLSLGVSRKQAG